MNLRLLALTIGAAVAGAAFAFLLVTLFTGDDDSSEGFPTDDPRSAGIPSFMTQQLDRYNAAGPDAIYGVVDMRVQAVCNEEQWGAALADVPAPGTFMELLDITFNDDDSADVRVAVVGDEEVVWRLTFLPNNRPKIWEIPGSEECTPV